MNRIKKGSAVVKKTDKNEIIFVVEKITSENKKKVAILKGLYIRIIEKIPVEDLELVDRKYVNKYIDERNKVLEKLFYTRKNSYSNMKPGKIVHLDGDRRYMEKSYKYYKKLGLNAIVKYVPEEKQEYIIKDLISRYKPDILVITGHDGMIRKGRDYSDIYNYMNSRFFVNTVRRAREHEDGKNLVIFAGACQSFFEALMSAGANFASSPARVLIDFADPLIVAEKVATTDSDCYVTMNDIVDDLRDGKDGIGGIGARGKKHKVTIS